MIFSIQRHLEDFFERTGLSDLDQYAIHLANVYERTRTKPEEARLKAFRRIQTAFYKRNRSVERKTFEELLLSRLDSKFKKKISDDETFPGGIQSEKHKIQASSRLTISSILQTFKEATEARGVDGFWRSRKQRKLQSRPEAVGQALLALFAKGTLGARRGLILREAMSGTGFIDVIIVLSNVPHLVEIKIVRSRIEGVGQIQTYMKRERRSIGWLLLLDARPHPRTQEIPKSIRSKDGLVRLIHVEINPIAPSQAKQAK